MCIDTVSLPNVSRYADISIYCCISSFHYTQAFKVPWTAPCFLFVAVQEIDPYFLRKCFILMMLKIDDSKNLI